MGILYYEINDEHRIDEAKLRLALHNYHAALEPNRFVEQYLAVPVPKEYFGVIAYGEDKPVGFADGYLDSHTDHRTTQVVRLGNFYVEDGYRRQGIGTELLRRFENLARIKGARTMRIGVVSPNKEAIRFYSRHLYQQVELVFERGI